MKKVCCIVIAIVMLAVASQVSAFADESDFLIGSWTTEDGIKLSFDDDGTFKMEWGYFPTEEGGWSAEALSDDTFTIEMDGSLVLTLMSTVYGQMYSDYHFEVLKCDENNFYLVQVSEGETAKSSKCKLGFTREGEEEDFSYTPEEDAPTNKKAPAKKKEKKERSENLVIKSDNGDDRKFVFDDNEELEDLVSATSSDTYSPRLAYCLSCLARSAYTQDLVKDNYKNIGFDKKDIKQEHYGVADRYDQYTAFTVGKMMLDDDRMFVLITIRGTSDLSEWINTNFALALNKTELSESAALHSGFYNCEEDLYKKLYKFLGNDIPDEDVTYVITGHSLGGAVGNLLAMRLYKEGVSRNDVYDYNFASPLVGAGSSKDSVWNDNGEHSNIINICNQFDIVPSRPTLNDYPASFFDYAVNGWSHFKRFGTSYWFDNGFMNYFDAHNMCAYIDYLATLHNEDNFRDTEYKVNVISGRCPVDIMVYDSDGEAIAGTKNNKPDYYGYEPGEKAIINANEDEKIIYILNDDKCDVRVEATDKGEMEFHISTLDLISGEVFSTKLFNPVKLKNKKLMRCEYGGEIEASDAKLFVVDDEDKVLAEVMEDGTEKAASGKGKKAGRKFVFHWWYILIILGIILLIAVLVILIAAVISNIRRRRRIKRQSALPRRR